MICTKVHREDGPFFYVYTTPHSSLITEFVSSHSSKRKMNGKILTDKASPRGAYSHIRKAGDLYFVAGTSSRRKDNSFAGVNQIDEMGTMHLDIREQTKAVIENIRDILQSEGLGLENVVDVTSYLVNMNDFAGYNEVFKSFFQEIKPTRTTVAVHQLPHPNLIVEIKVTAYKK